MLHASPKASACNSGSWIPITALLLMTNPPLTVPPLCVFPPPLPVAGAQGAAYGGYGGSGYGGGSNYQSAWD